MKLLLSIHAKNKEASTSATMPTDTATSCYIGAGQHSMFVPVASPQANEQTTTTSRQRSSSVAFVAAILLLLMAAGALVSTAGFLFREAGDATAGHEVDGRYASVFLGITTQQQQQTFLLGGR